MNRIAVVCMAAAIAVSALAAPLAVLGADTFYIRSDGGDTRQCTGRTDAAYPGRGRGKACAWRHPFDALPPNDEARIEAGDTLIIGPGDYAIGWGAPDLPDSKRCYAEARWDCYPAAVPSGVSSAERTRILGKGHAGGCAAAPRLLGVERVAMVLNLEGSSNVEIGCLEISDQSDCVEFHVDAGIRCKREQPPYGNWGSSGIAAKASRNVWLHDLDIHGMANRGIIAGGLSDWTVERVKINANGWAGWDGDIGKESSNSGQIALRHIEIAWNGCGERWQTRAVHGCWAQESGGYGDGLGTAETGGSWLIEDAYVHHNTSDGIDLLYLDGADSTSAVLRRVRAEGNAGNQIKTEGNALIENSVVVGNCAYFDRRDAMTRGDQCRALGNAVSVGLGSGHTVQIRHNTITGEGDCLLLSAGGSPDSRLEVDNNAFIGQIDWRANREGSPGELTCGHYADGGTPRVRFAGNAFWNVKGRQCPPGNLCGRNPRLTNLSLKAFDPVPLPGSPLIDAAAKLKGISGDGRGRARSVGEGPDIGAIEATGHR